MLCLDLDKDGFDFYGPESGGIFSELDIMIMPCNIKLTAFGAESDRIEPECQANLQK